MRAEGPCECLLLFGGIFVSRLNKKGENTMEKKKTSFKIPHTYVLLIGVMLVMAILTWIVPAGQFERIEQAGRTI